MLSKAQKIILYLSAVAALVLGLVLVIPFRTLPGITVNQGETVLIVELCVKGAILIAMLALSAYPCVLKYQQIENKLERSRVVNTIAYLPLGVYLIGVLALCVNILAYSQALLGFQLWALLFFAVAFDLAFVVVGFLLLPKFLMKLTRTLTIIFDLAVALFAVCSFVLIAMLSTKYADVFGTLDNYYGVGNPVLFFTYVLALIGFVATLVCLFRMTKRDLTELYINFEIQNDEINLVKNLEYKRAYNDILDEFEVYFAEKEAESTSEKDAEEAAA